MLALKFIRENPDLVLANLIKRNNLKIPEELLSKIKAKFGEKVDLNHPDVIAFLLENKGEYKKNPVQEILELDEKHRKLLVKVQEKQSERNKISKEIGKLKKEGKDASEIISKMKSFSNELAQLEKEVKELKTKIEERLLWLPNILLEDVPLGGNEDYGKILREEGEKKEFSFSPKPHWEILVEKGLLHLEVGAKISGSGFPVYTGKLAKLERALINFMLDFHSKNGFIEIMPPFLVTPKTLQGTGQLPKLKEDMYYVGNDQLYLIPTAEVPVTNFSAGEILAQSELPKYFVSYTPCFRREAGSYGKDTRGFMRIHQFNKVELVKYSLPEKSEEEFETLLAEAEAILKELRLPYRVVALCSGDVSFAAAKCYDLEVWAPGVEKYLEVSSCSTFTDFQARRANIRFRREGQKKPEFIHTLNASGVALPRVVIAIVENYQLPDGRIEVPEVLKKYLNFEYI